MVDPLTNIFIGGVMGFLIATIWHLLRPRRVPRPRPRNPSIVIEPGIIYTHSGNGVEYTVEDFCEMKDPFSGKWVSAVRYYLTNHNDNPRRFYVRELEAFKRRFVRRHDQ